jgi:hypothetical protein
MKVEDAKRLSELTTKHEIMMNFVKSCWEDCSNICLMAGGNIVSPKNIDLQLGYDLKEVIERSARRYEEAIENFQESEDPKLIEGNTPLMLEA